MFAAAVTDERGEVFIYTQFNEIFIYFRLYLQTKNIMSTNVSWRREAMHDEKTAVNYLKKEGEGARAFFPGP